MDKVYAESMVRIMIKNACNLCIKGMNDKVDELRSSVERLVYTYDLDEHFIDEFDMDVEDVKERQNKKPRVEFDSNGESGNIFYILGLCKTTLNDASLFKSIFENVKKTNYQGALAEIRKYINLVDIAGEY